MDTTRSLPSGTVTFLFTDIEGSTKLWEQHPNAMQTALARHDAVVHQTIDAHSGVVFKTVGDAFCTSFATATDALRAAAKAQRALQAEPWGETGPLQVRMALHTGTAQARDGDYFGPPLNRVARLRDAGHGGQILLSQTTADLVREALPEAATLRDLGAHRLKDLEQPEHLFQFVHPDLPGDFPPLRSLEAFSHNLPRQLTRFVGREREIAEVERLLTATALLTLTGSGGCGKTRLALQVAADLVEEFTDGVWLVELAALADPALVPQTVAGALGVREESSRRLEATLTDQLRARSLLLVLDNCEHLLSACARLVESLLRACPKLRVLASSREGLGIAGEQTYRVPSLSLPDARHLPPLERLKEFEAVQLFADRARLSQSTFAVTEANATAVAQVCQRLDGIPLAIELAAARVKALPVEQLAARMGDFFRLLTGGSRTALPRQQTLRATIDWSYDLLSEPERTLLRRLSVFAGGWTLTAAEAISTGDGIEEWEVLDLLSALAEKSLVVYVEQDGEARYRLLETVRQYAREKLMEGGEAEAIHHRHACFFSELAKGAGQKLDQLAPEDDNLRAALRYWIETGEAESSLQLAVELRYLWGPRGLLTEAREWLVEALGLETAAEPTLSRVRALNEAFILAVLQGDLDGARPYVEEGLAICRELGNRYLSAQMLGSLSRLALEKSDYRQARLISEETLLIYREMGSPFDVARSLHELGRLSYLQGDYDMAQARLEESLARFRETGDPQQWGTGICLEILGQVADARGDHKAARRLLEERLTIARRHAPTGESVVNSLNLLGQVEQHRGDWQRAASLCRESLEIARPAGRKPLVAQALNLLGRGELHQGNRIAGRALLEESLTLSKATGSLQRITEGLESFAGLLAAEGQCERAARCLGAAEALRETMGAPLPPPERTGYERTVTAIRAGCSDEEFAAAWTEGRVMSLDEAFTCALKAVGADPFR